jgi:hypothetical protein
MSFNNNHHIHRAHHHANHRWQGSACAVVMRKLEDQRERPHNKKLQETRCQKTSLGAGFFFLLQVGLAGRRARITFYV